jgi:hypothetical protein
MGPVWRCALICSLAASLPVATIHSMQSAAPETVSITGCLLTEAQYAQAHGLARDAASANGAVTSQLVVVLDGVTHAYAVTGPGETRLASDVGHRVALEGVIEPAVVRNATEGQGGGGDSALTPAGAVGVTDAGSPAHEPSDATGGLRPRVVSPATSPSDRIAAIDDLVRINVSSARRIDGTCSAIAARQASTPARVATGTSGAGPAPSGSPAPNSRSSGSADVTVTLAGCLELRDDSATDSKTYLALTDARPVERVPRTGSAVPGSLPAGSGSGTVGTTGVARGDAVAESRAYRLSGQESALTAYVGRRVEVTGRIDSDESRSNRETAHTSAPEQRVGVTSFQSIGGSCRK